MGHYDDCYEADADRKKQQERKEDIETMAKMDKVMREMELVVWGEFARSRTVDERVHLAFEELEREYIVWQKERNLLIRDPEIIMDVLKDKK